MTEHRIMCRPSAAATRGIEPTRRARSTGSVGTQDPDEEPRPKMSRASSAPNGATFESVVGLPEAAAIKSREATMRVLSEIKGVATAKSMRTAVRMVFSQILALLDAGDERAVDELLSCVSPEEFPVEVSLAFLSITVMARARLPARAGLKNRIHNQLVARRGEEDVARLLAGL